MARKPSTQATEPITVDPQADRAADIRPSRVARASVFHMRMLASQLNIAWEDVIKDADLSRTSVWRLENDRPVGPEIYERVWRVLDRVWQQRISEHRGSGIAGGVSETLRRWNESGRDLLMLDIAMFERLLRTAEEYTRTRREIIDIVDGARQTDATAEAIVERVVKLTDSTVESLRNADGLPSRKVKTRKKR